MAIKRFGERMFRSLALVAVLVSGCAQPVTGRAVVTVSDQQTFVLANDHSLCYLSHDSTWIEVTNGITHLSLVGETNTRAVGRLRTASTDTAHECVVSVTPAGHMMNVTAQCGSGFEIEFNLFGCE